MIIGWQNLLEVQYFMVIEDKKYVSFKRETKSYHGSNPYVDLPVSNFLEQM
jgi:hypothetical protein